MGTFEERIFKTEGVASPWTLSRACLTCQKAKEDAPSGCSRASKEDRGEQPDRVRTLDHLKDFGFPLSEMGNH